MRKQYMSSDDDLFEDEFQSESDLTDEEFPHVKKPSFARGQLLTITRVILCLLLVGFAFAARAVGGGFYASTASWYFDRFNSSVFTEGKNRNTVFRDEASITETSLATPDSGSDGSTTPALPLAKGTITSPYGQREYNGEQQFHKGVDIAADRSSEIMAVFDGEVTVAENDPSYGNYIVLAHQDGSKTLYAHCEKLLVSKGENVKAGSPIALVGSTGDADGCHLHLELIRDDKNADPSALLGDSYK
ncbi:MAG: M23 family metallopeptidase [Clostridia bacterium]|nr:M23 family metallopeptidase [Clostridia bacterium]